MAVVDSIYNLEEKLTTDVFFVLAEACSVLNVLKKLSILSEFWDDEILFTVCLIMHSPLVATSSKHFQDVGVIETLVADGELYFEAFFSLLIALFEDLNAHILSILTLRQETNSKLTISKFLL